MSFNLIKEMGNLGALAQGVGAGINLVNAQFDAVDRAEFFNEFSRLQTRQMDINAKFMNETVKNDKFTDFAKLPELYNQHVQDNIMPLVNDSSNPYAKEAIKDMIMKGMVQDKQALEAVAYTRRASKAYTDMVGMIEQAAQTGDTTRVKTLLAMGQAGGQFSTEDYLIKTEKYYEKAVSIGLSEQMGQAQTVQDWDKIAADILNPESLTVEYSGVQGPEKYSASQTIRDRLYNTVLEGKKQWYTGKVNEGLQQLTSAEGQYMDNYGDYKNRGINNIDELHKMLAPMRDSPYAEVRDEAVKTEKRLQTFDDKALQTSQGIKTSENISADLWIQWAQGKIDASEVNKRAKGFMDQGMLTAQDVKTLFNGIKGESPFASTPALSQLADRYKNSPNALGALTKEFLAAGSRGEIVNNVLPPKLLERLNTLADQAQKDDISRTLKNMPVTTGQEQTQKAKEAINQGRDIQRDAAIYKQALANPTGRTGGLGTLVEYRDNVITALSRMSIEVNATKDFDQQTAQPIFKTQNMGFIRPGYNDQGARVWYRGDSLTAVNKIIGNDSALQTMAGKTPAQIAAETARARTQDKNK